MISIGILHGIFVIFYSLSENGFKNARIQSPSTKSQKSCKSFK